MATVETTTRTEVLDIAEVAKWLDVSTSSVRRWVATGQMPGPIRLGRRCLRFRKDEIEKWLADQDDSDHGL